MIIGIGTDHIEVKRIEKSIESESFLQKIFTRTEIEFCNSKKQNGQCYAARFAVKEAFLKALGTGLRGALRFQDIEVMNNELGKPEINVSGEAKKYCDEMSVKKIHVSLSHIKDSAMAIVILEN
jgi:holo-[acyl-carrier protein] synthase